MKAGTPNSTWIAIMMAASQLLLMLFTGNWLHAQYGREKERLSKDIKQVLLQSTRELSDSSLYAKLVSPLLKANGTAMYRDSTSVNETPLGHKKIFKSVMVMTADSSMSKAILGKNRNNSLKHNIHLAQNDSIILDLNGMMGNHERFVVKSDTATEMLKSIVPVLIKQISVNTGVNMPDSFLGIDTGSLHKRLLQAAARNNWTFKTVWISDDRQIKPGQGIVVTANINSNKLLVQGYRWQLLKSISPQILFVLVLLLLTGFSFVFAYRSLRKQMRLSAMKNDFISNMSHELKTPIATVKVALEALDNFNRVNDPEKTRDYIKMANIEMNRLDMLVNQALNTSLLEAGKIVLQRQSQDVQQLINETAAIFKYRLQQPGGAIDLSFEGENFVASIDKTHFQGVLINILDNSLKYSDKTPAIHIITKATTNHISIAIKDNGPGIPQEYIKNVFDKFFRVPMGDTHNVKGYGLGLSYAKQVVELHYGTIDVRNLPEGGCVFTIDIPKSHL